MKKESEDNIITIPLDIDWMEVPIKELKARISNITQSSKGGILSQHIYQVQCVLSENSLISLMEGFESEKSISDFLDYLQRMDVQRFINRAFPEFNHGFEGSLSEINMLRFIDPENLKANEWNNSIFIKNSAATYIDRLEQHLTHQIFRQKITRTFIPFDNMMLFQFPSPGTVTDFRGMGDAIFRLAVKRIKDLKRFHWKGDVKLWQRQQRNVNA